MPEKQLANQLNNLAQAAVTDTRINDADLIPILRFVGKVVLVVEQAFDEVYGLLIQLRHLKPEDLLEPRRTELLSGLDAIQERSRYRDVEEICSRLHHLSEQYERAIQPRLGSLADDSRWQEVFDLLNEAEGRIIMMLSDRVYDIRARLSSAKNADLPTIREYADGAAAELRDTLKQLWQLRNNILGLSGEAGFLELLETGQRGQAIAVASDSS